MGKSSQYRTTKVRQQTCQPQLSYHTLQVSGHTYSHVTTVDEDSFMQQFPVSGLLTVQTQRGLDLQLMTVWTGLTSVDWRRRVQVRRRLLRE